MARSNEISEGLEDDRELSLKELVTGLREWIRFFLRKWKVLLIVAVIGAGLGALYAYNKKPTYKAELTFVLEDSKSGGLGAYAGLASQFGIDLGSLSPSGSSGIFSGDNLLGFLKTRLMVQRALLTDTIWNGKPVTLADLYLDVYKWRERWQNRPELANLSFPVHTGSLNMSYLQDSVMDLLHKAIVDKNLDVDKPDKKLSFIAVSTNSINPVFSKLFTERIVRAAIDFYVKTKTQRAQANVDKLQEQADSIELALDNKTVYVARNEDVNLNPSRKLAMVGLELASRDKIILNTLYGEVAKNLELAKMSLAQETPIIQLVDTPTWPLQREKLGMLRGTILGAFILCLLAMVVMGLRRAYRQVMGADDTI